MNACSHRRLQSLTRGGSLPALLLLLVLAASAAPSRAASPQGGLPALEVPDPERREQLLRRRARVLEEMGPGSIGLLLSHPPQWYAGDVFYEYRQANNLYYLTGISRPDIALLLLPGHPTHQAVLFLPERDPSREAWTGRMLSPDEAGEISGVAAVWPRQRLEPTLEALLQRRPPGDPEAYRHLLAALAAGEAAVYLDLHRHPGLDGEPTPEMRLADRLRRRFTGFRIADISDAIHGLRAVKDPYEVRQLREAVRITGEAHRRAMAEAAPGRWEYEVEAAIEHVFKASNAAVGFPSIVASGPNATTLHYEESQRQLQDGDLLLVDIGAEVNHYTADVTRTFPVSGRFSPEQRAVYEIVLGAQLAAEELLRPGVAWSAIHQRATEVLVEGLLELGLITEPTPEQYRRWWLHGVGHPIGLAVHDVWGGDRSLRAGQVVTVEPGIYVRPDALEHLSPTPEGRAFAAAVEGAFRRYRGIGVRIEDDYLITEEGFEHLSDDVPRTVEGIEAWTTGEQGR